MPNATYQVEADWDNSGLFDSASGAYEDITAYVRARPGVAWDHGNDVLRAQQPPAAGAFSARLHNASHLFSLDNAAGGLYGNLKPRRRLRLQASYGGTTYPQWRGLSDALRELVDRQQQAVDLSGIGNLAWLTGSRGRGVRAFTQLYSSIRTDQALGYLLDAVGWPKTLPALLTDNPGARIYSQEGLGEDLVGYWRLGEASGDALDSSARGYDGTVTIGAGTRAAAALDDQGDGCINFDGAATTVQVADATWIRDIWTGTISGASLAFCINPDPPNGGQGCLISKYDSVGATGGWTLGLTTSPGFLSLEFLVVFTGGVGQWRTTAPAIPTSALTAGVLVYNGDAITNNPVLYLWDATNGYRVCTVGDGLTEVSTPAGTCPTDLGFNLYLGSADNAAGYFDGKIDEVAVFYDALTAAQARSYIDRVLWCPRILDTGLTTLAWWWLGGGDDAFLNMQQVLNAEGPGGSIYEDRSGRFVFESRRYRSLTSRCTTSQATFRDTGAEPLHSAPCIPSQGYDSVINTAQLAYKTRSAKGSAQVWALGETISFAAQERRYFVAHPDDPVQNAIAPSEGAGDFTVVAGAISTVYRFGDGSGQDIPFYMIAGDAGATVTGLIMRAQSVTVDNTTKVTNSNVASDSQAEYGVRGYSQTVWPELDALVTAQALADAYVAWFQQPVRSIALTVNNGHADRLTQILSRTISDRITVIEAGTTLNAAFFIEHLTHELPQGRFEHLTRFDCTRCEDWFGEMFTLDSTGSGILDSNRLGF